MRYPLSLRFKLAAISSQITATNADNDQLFYVKQKLFKLKEKVEIFRDNTKSELLFTISTDRVIDFSPLFTMTKPDGTVVGTIKRRGRASILKATYDIELEGQPAAQVREANPWVKVVDALVSEVPILGLVSGYVFHPKYLVTDNQANPIASLDKKPAFFEGAFDLVDNGISGMEEEKQIYLSALLMMVALMERSRG